MWEESNSRTFFVCILVMVGCGSRRAESGCISAVVVSVSSGEPEVPCGLDTWY